MTKVKLENPPKKQGQPLRHVRPGMWVTIAGTVGFILGHTESDSGPGSVDVLVFPQAERQETLYSMIRSSYSPDTRVMKIEAPDQIVLRWKA